MSKKQRLFSIVTALLVCQVIPYLGAVWGAPVGVVVSCYVLAVFSVFFTDWTINIKKGHKKTPVIYCNVCGEGRQPENIGQVFGQLTCVECAENIGEPLQQRGVH